MVGVWFDGTNSGHPCQPTGDDLVRDEGTPVHLQAAASFKEWVPGVCVCVCRMFLQEERHGCLGVLKESQREASQLEGPLIWRLGCRRVVSNCASVNFYDFGEASWIVATWEIMLTLKGKP